METRTIKITGMSCNHCVMSVRKELMKIPGLDVKDVRIGEATVAYDPARVRPETIEAAISEAGYEAAG